MQNPLILALAAATALCTPAGAERPDPVSQDVTLRLTFDERTLQALRKRGELVVVSALYFGEAAPGKTEFMDEMGNVFLGNAELTLWPGDQTVLLPPIIASAPLSDVIEPRLNINVYSARISSSRNVLNCGIADDTLAVLAASAQTISCTLLK